METPRRIHIKLLVMLLSWKDRMIGELLLYAFFISVLFKLFTMNIIIFVIKNTNKRSKNLPSTKLSYCNGGKGVRQRQIYTAHGLGMPPEKKPNSKAYRKWWEEEVEEKEEVKTIQGSFSSE